MVVGDVAGEGMWSVATQPYLFNVAVIPAKAGIQSESEMTFRRPIFGNSNEVHLGTGTI